VKSLHLMQISFFCGSGKCRSSHNALAIRSDRDGRGHCLYLVGITPFGIQSWLFAGNESSEQYSWLINHLGWFNGRCGSVSPRTISDHPPWSGYRRRGGARRDGLVIGNFEWMAGLLIRLALMGLPRSIFTRAGDNWRNSWRRRYFDLPAVTSWQ